MLFSFSDDIVIQSWWKAWTSMSRPTQIINKKYTVSGISTYPKYLNVCNYVNFHFQFIISLEFFIAHTNAHTHSCMHIHHTYNNTHTHMHNLLHLCVCVCVIVCVCARTGMHNCTNAHTHTCTHTHVHAHTVIHMHTDTLKKGLGFEGKFERDIWSIHTHTHTHMHTHTHTHTPW